ncbi:uncharacterized protein BDV17DRAFT_276989 [Aspergillus undulatus]|uniref:uncharacterized protein n=1 Tax=Aspergillus undulatus TaxID=1810928 RepID=UPI003CCE3C40
MTYYQMDHSYPTMSSRSSRNASIDSSSSMGSNNPYRRFLSPSPTRSAMRHRRSPSIPSSDYADFVDDSQYNRGRRSSGYNRRRSQLVNPDIIDRLDTASRFSYHHEGPYDAVYPERNKIALHSPIDALRESNEEALRATPHHKIADSVNRHRPLDGVAYFPPGHTDHEGQTYEYEEGHNMMNDYGNFSRFPGFKFTDEDFKNDPFYNTPVKPFAPIRNAFRRSLRRKHRASTA